MLKRKKFQKKVEDFTCEKCGEFVKGSGYTDHCPHCLWSKHVDINPGDREAECGGMMRPVGVEVKGGERIINYFCEGCGYQHKVKSAENDSVDKIIEISSKVC